MVECRVSRKKRKIELGFFLVCTYLTDLLTTLFVTRLYNLNVLDNIVLVCVVAILGNKPIMANQRVFWNNPTYWIINPLKERTEGGAEI